MSKERERGRGEKSEGERRRGVKVTGREGGREEKQERECE